MPKSPIVKFNSLTGPVLDRKTGFFKTGNHLELVKEAVIRLIFTRKGTRMGLLDYGTNIPDLVFTNDWEGLSNTITFEIGEVLAKWEPRVQFTGITMLELDNAYVNFQINFIELITNTEQSLPVTAEFTQ